MAAGKLVEAGATSVIALVTHGILSGAAFEKLAGSAISKLVVTNSIPQTTAERKSDILEVIDISHVLAETIRRSFNGESISWLFDAVPYTEALKMCVLRSRRHRGLTGCRDYTDKSDLGSSSSRSTEKERIRPLESEQQGL
jgi:hypothetical protein